MLICLLSNSDEPTSERNKRMSAHSQRSQRHGNRHALSRDIYLAQHGPAARRRRAQERAEETPATEPAVVSCGVNGCTLAKWEHSPLHGLTDHLFLEPVSREFREDFEKYCPYDSDVSPLDGSYSPDEMHPRTGTMVSARPLRRI